MKIKQRPKKIGSLFVQLGTRESNMYEIQNDFLKTIIEPKNSRILIIDLSGKFEDIKKVSLATAIEFASNPEKKGIFRVILNDYTQKELINKVYDICEKFSKGLIVVDDMQLIKSETDEENNRFYALLNALRYVESDVHINATSSLSKDNSFTSLIINNASQIGIHKGFEFNKEEFNPVTLRLVYCGMQWTTCNIGKQAFIDILNKNISLR